MHEIKRPAGGWRGAPRGYVTEVEGRVVPRGTLGDRLGAALERQARSAKPAKAAPAVARGGPDDLGAVVRQLGNVERLRALVERRQLEATPLGRRALAAGDVTEHARRALADAEQRAEAARRRVRALELSPVRGRESAEVRRRELEGADLDLRRALREVEQRRLDLERAELAARAARRRAGA